MKHLTFLTVAILFFCSISGSRAESTTTVPNNNPHPNAHQVNLRMKKQWVLIQKGIKSGKITKTQAASLRTSLKATREQEITFLKQNGTRELAVDQQSQLNSSLNQNSSTLGETANATTSN